MRHEGHSVFADHDIVFGTDHFNIGNHFMKRTVEYLDSLDVISPAEREMIYHVNAERILPRR